METETEWDPTLTAADGVPAKVRLPAPNNTFSESAALLPHTAAPVAHQWLHGPSGLCIREPSPHHDCIIGISHNHHCASQALVAIADSITGLSRHHRVYITGPSYHRKLCITGSSHHGEQTLLIIKQCFKNLSRSQGLYFSRQSPLQPV